MKLLILCFILCVSATVCSADSVPTGDGSTPIAIIDNDPKAAKTSPAPKVAGKEESKNAEAKNDNKKDDTKDAKDAKSSGAARASRKVDLPIEKTQPVRVPRFEAVPVIDGKLDDDIWKHAVVLKGFYQVNPGDNTEPSKPTEVLIGYDARHIYFAFRCYDEPDKIRATFTNRDNVFGEDNIRIFLDTFNDQRRAYVIGFNPYGIQQDGVHTEGRGQDYNVDIVMESKGVITADGWTVEAKIPFKSLRYEAGEGKFWGFHVWRNIDRFNDEMDSWMPLSRDIFGTLNQAGKITGLENISTEHTLEVIPSFTASEGGRRVPKSTPANPLTVDPGRFVNSPLDFDAGLSLKYSVTPNITLDAAFNPDFAQVEADATVVTTNQRFPIFYAERRPFFLEGIDIFQTSLQAVHTRAIVDPDYAVKLTGKQGRNVFGVLLASDNAPGNYSDEERGDPELRPRIERFLDKNAYIGIARLRRDVGQDSNIGFLATTYNFIEKHNHLAGVDGRFRVDPKTIFTFQVLGTKSRRFFYDPEEDASRYRTGDGLAYQWLYDVTGRYFGYLVGGSGRTQDYRADVGFTRRTNTNNLDFGWRVSSEPNATAKLVIDRALRSFATVSYDFQGRVQSWDNSYSYAMRFQRQTTMELNAGFGYERLFEEEFGARRSASRGGAFFGDDAERSARNASVGFETGTTWSQKFSHYISLGYDWGEFDFDFGAGARFPRVSPAALVNPEAALDPGPGKGPALDVYLTFRPTNEWSSSFNYSRSKLTRNDTRQLTFDSNIFSLHSTYQFTPFTFVRARMDYDTLAAKAFGQFLFGWTPNPGTAVYAGYNDDLSRNGYSPFTGQYEPGFHRNRRTFFVKMSYLFRRTV